MVKRTSDYYRTLNARRKLAREPRSVRLFSRDDERVQKLAGHFGEDLSEMIRNLVHEALNARDRRAAERQRAIETGEDSGQLPDASETPGRPPFGPKPRQKRPRPSESAIWPSGPPGVFAASRRCRRARLAIVRGSGPLDKRLNALHNPVTLPVVCQLMLLRSIMGVRSVT